MPKKAGMEKWKKKRRQEYLEMKQYRYYIFCEGQQTETLYFEGFKKLIKDNPIYKDMVLIEIEPCQAETMRVIGMAERYVAKNKIQKGQIWCVYDKTCEIVNWYIPSSILVSMINKNIQKIFKDYSIDYNICIVGDMGYIINGTENLQTEVEIPFATIECFKHDNDEMACLPEVFYTILPGYRPQPHKGMEYGDVAAEVKIGNNIAL